MRYILITVLFITALSSCNQKSEEEKKLRKEMDALKQSLDSMYSPEKFDSMKKSLEDELKALDTLEKQSDSMKKEIERMNKELN